MLIAVISILGILALTYLSKRPLRERFGFSSRALTTSAQGIVLILIMFGLVSRSFVIVDANEVGHLKRIYLAANLPQGKIIAANEEKGPQAETITPGFHFIWLVKILNEIEFYKVVDIPEGHYGLLQAKDGLPLRDGQYLADSWGEKNFEKMLNAKYFLTAGKGQKGPQLSILPPGKYRLNRYLFTVTTKKTLDVPTGHVAVIRSNVQTVDKCQSSITSQGRTGEKVATPIVPKGCVGVWDVPYPPGRYYLNEKAYVTTIIPTRVQNWTYLGGHTVRTINLTLDDSGTIHQQETRREIPIPKGAADRAINVRVEGWTVPVDMRVIIQVHPKDAPVVVAAVGNLQSV